MIDQTISHYRIVDAQPLFRAWHFLLMEVRNPSANRTLIAFAAWSSK